jgi:SAM-dependent methyltransferase
MLYKIKIYTLIFSGFVWSLGAQCYAGGLDKEMRRVGQSQNTEKSPLKLRETANRMGFEDTAINDLLKKYLTFAPTAPGHLMDIGCAKGFAIQEILSLEAKAPFLRPQKRKIFALDMGKEHIEHVSRNTPADLVEPHQIHFPPPAGSDQISSFAPDTIGAVYAGLVFHFLNGPELRQGLTLLYKAVAPGGRIFASVNSPLDSPAMSKDFLHRKNVLKEEYPGWFENYNKMLPDFIRNQVPDFIHAFDVDTLTRYTQDAGFKVIECYYFQRGSGMMMMKLLGIIAEKPNLNSSK